MRPAADHRFAEQCERYGGQRSCERAYCGSSCERQRRHGGQADCARAAAFEVFEEGKPAQTRNGQRPNRHVGADARGQNGAIFDLPGAEHDPDDQCESRHCRAQLGRLEGGRLMGPGERVVVPEYCGMPEYRDRQAEQQSPGPPPGSIHCAHDRRPAQAAQALPTGGALSLLACGTWPLQGVY